MKLIDAVAFIDWDSAQRIRRPPWGFGEVDVPLRRRAQHVGECFFHIQERTARAIETMNLTMPVKIMESRIYHGWHRGLTPTDDRRAWEMARPDFRPVTTKSVSFLPDVRFGNDMVCGGTRLPLVDTLRSRDDGKDQQKMVDTALVADLLCFCRTESSKFKRGKQPSSLALIIGDDDDLLPGGFAAERWGLPVKVLRVTREQESRFLRLHEMVYAL